MVVGRLNGIFRKFGYTLNRNSLKGYEEFIEEYNFCKPYTLTGIERMFSLYKAVEYIVKQNIPGDFVECGVWKGGSSMLIAKTLLKFGVTDRKIWMYDTYEGMSEPDENDVDNTGNNAKTLLNEASKQDSDSVWCYSALDEVKNNMLKTSYPTNLVHFVKGKVEDTIPDQTPNNIALLRLDTDWYESTRHEMIHLFPKLFTGGVLIIDDYGHWVGARKAIDEYISENAIRIFLCNIDYTGRIAIKQ